MTRPDLDAIRARCDAATRGPWRVDGSTYDEDCNEHLAPYGLEGPNERLIWSSGGGEYSHPDMDTAQFIAHARTDVPALLAYIDELERRATHTVGETEWAHRIAVAEQRFVDEYNRRKAACRVIDELEEQALTHKERLEQCEHERDQERTVFEQAMAEAQTNVMELRAQLAELKARITTLEAMR